MPGMYDEFALGEEMRIAFYAPMKPAEDLEPSGDRRLARSFMSAFSHLGHDVRTASTFRSYDGTGDADRQARLRGQARAIAANWPANADTPPPDLWFTYHLYHKAPDWLGPAIARRLRIPYIVAEASHAPKQANGPWRAGFVAARDAILQADRIICVNPTDEPCLTALRGGRRGMSYLPPFIERQPVRSPRDRQRQRAEVAASRGLDAEIPWLCTAAMMREGAKTDSYDCLARAINALPDRAFHLLIAGDGPNRDYVRRLFAGDERVVFLGECSPSTLNCLLGVSDLFVWPAVGEGFGMALLEAQSHGLPAVAGRTPGVASIVRDNVTGVLTAQTDFAAFAAAIDGLLEQRQRLAEMSSAARAHTERTHTIEAAAIHLEEIISGLGTSEAA